MTTATDGRPAEASGGQPPDPYVVRTSRRAVHREMVFTAVSVVIVLVLALTRDDGWRVADAAVIILFPALVSAQIRSWRRLLAADALMEVAPDGIRINRLGRGWVTLPWGAVGTVRLDVWGGAVVVRTAPGVGPSTPGTVWPPDGLGLRWARWWGFKVRTRLAEAEPHQMLAAVRHFRPASA